MNTVVIFFLTTSIIQFFLSWLIIIHPLKKYKTLFWLTFTVYLFSSCLQILTNTLGDLLFPPQIAGILDSHLGVLQIFMYFSLFFGFCWHLFVLFRSFAAKLIGYLKKKYNSTNSLYVKPDFKIPFLAIALCSVVLSVYACNNALTQPVIKNYTLYDHRFPQTDSGHFRIVLLSDTHYGTTVGPDDADLTAERVMKLNPDLILFAGDFADGSVRHAYPEMESFRLLKAPYGMMAVRGNHEYYYDIDGWYQRLTDLGFTVLDNDHRIIDVNGSKLVIAGVTDRAAAVTDGEQPMPDVKKALSGIDPAKDAVIFMSHEPALFPEAAAEGVLLTVSGHTHAGMIFGLDKLVKYVNKGYLYGLYREEDSKLIVSAGTYLWGGFAARLGVPPGEIVVIDLIHSAN